MLSVTYEPFMLSVIILSVVMLNDIMLSVMAPKQALKKAMVKIVCVM